MPFSKLGMHNNIHVIFQFNNCANIPPLNANIVDRANEPCLNEY